MMWKSRNIETVITVLVVLVGAMALVGPISGPSSAWWSFSGGS